MKQEVATESETELKNNDKKVEIGQKLQIRQVQQLPNEQAHEPDHPESQIIKNTEKKAALTSYRPKIISFDSSGSLPDDLNPQIEVNVNPEHEKVQLKQLQPTSNEIHLPIPSQGPVYQCNFCVELLGEQKFQKVFKCEHIFCSQCLKTYFETQINNFKTVTCPNQQCLKDLDEQADYFQNLDPQLKNKYQIIKFRKTIQKNQKLILCPDENCKKGFIELISGQKDGECKQCKVSYCTKCKIKSHSGKCESFQEILLKDKFKYKRCYGCKRIVERNQGCPHMTCKCGSQFCYYCGARWAVPHRCLRHLAGGELVTDKLSNSLKCLRVEDLEYSYTILGFISKIPYYLVSFLILTLYFAWCLTVLCVMIAVIFVGAFFAGYIALQYKLCRDGNTCGKVAGVLLLIFLPIGFIVGWFGAFGVGIGSGFPKYLELALSARLFPCCFR